MNTQPIKYLDPQQLLDGGYLHEINRLVLHPLGLALEVDRRDDDSFVGRVWDYREDPEGVVFGEDLLSAAKAEKVAGELLRRRDARFDKTGFVIQPPPTSERTLTVNYLDPPQ